jgi:hypothetical protein
LRPVLDASLAGGAAGQAILHSYRARVAPDAKAEASARRCVDHARDAVARVAMEPSLFGGFIGVAWMIEHLALGGGSEVEDDPLAPIDEALVHMDPRTPIHFDLMSGLAGVGLYALERLPRPRASECLQAVVARLAERAETIGDGCAWRTPPGALAAETVRRLGPFDLGVAHGVPGVIALLGAASRWDIATDQAPALLEGAVRWLLDRRRPAGESGRFAASAGAGSDPAPARLAWCYGDAGIAATLFVTARAIGRSDWSEQALALAREAAARSDETSGVQDACLCHGAAGLGLIFQRLHQATAEPIFAQAARHWYGRAIALHRSGEGFAGYASAFRGGWVADPGLLRGATGIALGLLAATSSVEPEWDRVLLLSSRGPKK